MTTSQKQFIDHLIEAKAATCIFLSNGIKLRGYVLDADDECMVLGGQTTQLVYMHSVATIMPEQQGSSQSMPRTGYSMEKKSQLQEYAA